MAAVLAFPVPRTTVLAVTAQHRAQGIVCTGGWAGTIQPHCVHPATRLLRAE